MGSTAVCCNHRILLPILRCVPNLCCVVIICGVLIGVVVCVVAKLFYFTQSFDFHFAHGPGVSSVHRLIGNVWYEDIVETRKSPTNSKLRKMLRNLQKISLVQKCKLSSAAPAPKINPEVLYTGVS